MNKSSKIYLAGQGYSRGEVENFLIEVNRQIQRVFSKRPDIAQCDYENLLYNIHQVLCLGKTISFVRVGTKMMQYVSQSIPNNPIVKTYNK